MLSAAALNVADRLIATLMTLVDAIHPIARSGSSPTFPDHAAHALFARLAHLVATLIRIANFGIRAPAKPATPKPPTQPDPSLQRSRPAARLPSHPGWLLAALPDIAPAVASGLAALLADPALTALLAAAPTLHRSLRPLLRSLGLTEPPDAAPDPTRVGGSAPHQPGSATPIADGRVPADLPHCPPCRVKSPD